MENPQCVKINIVLFKDRILVLTYILKELTNFLTRPIKICKGIPPKIAQHPSEPDTSISLVHKKQYQLKSQLCCYYQITY